MLSFELIDCPPKQYPISSSNIQPYPTSSNNIQLKQMIIYNVTVKVTHAIAGEWVRWMKEEHMQQLIDTGLFYESRLCKLLELDEEDGLTYVAQYFCDSMDDYQDYIKKYAPIMRDRGFKKFGDQFIAFRTLMQVEG